MLKKRLWGGGIKRRQGFLWKDLDLINILGEKKNIFWTEYFQKKRKKNRKKIEKYFTFEFNKA